MMTFGRTIGLAAALALSACAAAPTPPPAPIAAAPAETRTPVVILVSIDGFRPDYLDRGVTPNLNALKADGVSAAMRPSFPSKTFPNHWTLVTGLVPDHHGIVGNTMIDPARPGETFHLSTDDPWWWNAAEPVWVTAEKAGIRTATEFWPGASIAWGSTAKKDEHGIVAGGVRPEDWHQYEANVTGLQRVAAVLDWMRRPTATRPRFVTLYFDTVDSAGHEFGPTASQTTAAVADVDRSIGALVEGLAALDQPANLVVVADHGMAATSTDRVIALDTLAPAADYAVVESGPYASLDPVPGHEAAVDRALIGHHPHMDCWRKRDIPARLHYGTNARIPAILCLAEPGWLVLKTPPAKAETGGNHGYDNAAPDMAALFIADGPAFAHDKRLPPFDNVDVAPLLRDLLGLPPGHGLDGTDTPFKGVLRR